jgi:uncharacterized membrane protein YdjX (TVP38/TMEM64 family)
MLNQLIKDHPKILNTKNYVRIIGILIFVLIAFWASLKFDFEEVKLFIQDHEGQAILISIVIYILFGFTFLPSIPLTLFIAALIGPLEAALVAALGNTLAALFEYQIGKTVGDAVAFDDIKSKLPLGLDTLPVDSPLFMLGARSIPAGSRAFSMVCGAYQVPMPTYLWTTSLMYLVSSALLTFGGIKIINLL